MLDFIGRLLLVSIFLWSGFFEKPMHLRRISGRIGDLGIPFPTLFAVAATALEITASFVILFPGVFGGAWIFLTAVWALTLYTLITAILFHPFWAHSGQVRTAHLVNFLKNLGLIGAFLLLAGQHANGGRLI